MALSVLGLLLSTVPAQAASRPALKPKGTIAGASALPKLSYAQSALSSFAGSRLASITTRTVR
jgi:hypothetical protein